MGEKKKRRQHHVWQGYLKSWLVDDKIACMTGDKIFRGSTLNIAVDRDFYAIKKLNKLDVLLLERLIEDTRSDPAKRTHRGFIQKFMIPEALEGLNAEADALIDVYRTNVLEDHYANIERSFIPLLARALKGDVSFYLDDKECIIFIHYLCSQHMRTKAIQTKIVEKSYKGTGLDFSRIWPIMAHMYAINIGGPVYVERRRRKLVLLKNHTDMPFITGDQPVVNLLSVSDEPPTELAFYYPISPNLALLINEVDGDIPLTSDGLTVEQVCGLNAKILAASHSQIFGCSDVALMAAKTANPWQPQPVPI
ncbi:DUF4238 domain-containing protein [Pseudomonas pergaminensis]|uniref:DUF4238 domain-containing protein n=1 Tax=Pseudomonas pergaminensis TaxID=2853159 RepID=A0ABW8R789_9PSED